MQTFTSRNEADTHCQNIGKLQRNEKEKRESESPLSQVSVNPLGYNLLFFLGKYTSYIHEGTIFERTYFENYIYVYIYTRTYI